MSLVRVERLSKVYDLGVERVRAVDDVSLSAAEGEFVALVGPSGSGKSTLLHLIGGLDRPTSGEVFLDGAPYSAMSDGDLARLRRDRIGFVFQAYNLIPALTAEENVEYVMMLQGVPAADRRARAERVLEQVGLGGYGGRRPDMMSGGQQQRVAVARAIASGPRLVLADEPTANLDSKTGEALMNLFDALHLAEGVTFLFSTHDPMVMERAGRIVRLHDGKVEDAGA